MSMFKDKFVLRNADAGLDAGGGGEGSGAAELPTEASSGIDMAAAVDEIGKGLGFNTEPTEKPAEPAEPATPAPPAAPAPAPVASTPAAAPIPAFSAEKAPNTWSPAVAASWEALPLEVRTEIAKREADMFKGLETYKTEASFAKEVKSFLRPIEGLLQANSIPPQQFLGNLVNAHMTLANPQLAPAQKREIALNILKNYGIEVDAPAQPTDDGTYIDPEVLRLRTELSALQSRLDGADTRAANDVRQKLLGEVNAFAQDPANQYFEEVADDVAMLIRGSGGALNLKEAYERAVRANPVTWAKEVTRLQTEAVTKAQQEAKERADKAKRLTSVNVKSGGHQGSGTAPSGSMDDTMKATMRAIVARTG